MGAADKLKNDNDRADILKVPMGENASASVLSEAPMFNNQLNEYGVSEESKLLIFNI
jgi:hypothetical protein